MDRDDVNYIHEQSREEKEGFPLCRCSNCDPEEAQILKDQMRMMSNQKFDRILEDLTYLPTPIVTKPNTKKKKNTRAKEVQLTPVMLQMLSLLENQFNIFFHNTYRKARSFLPEQLFGQSEANSIAAHFEEIEQPEDIAQFIGGETLEGQLAMLHKTMINFKEQTEYKEYMKEQQEYDIHIGNEMECIQNLKRKPRISAQLEANGTQKEKKAANISASSARAQEVEERKIARAEKKRKKDKQDAVNKEAKKKKWQEDSAILEGIKKDYMLKRGLTGEKGR